MRTTQRYGWKPDLPDHRDHFLPALVSRVPLPASVDLRLTGFLPPIYDQGQAASCTANAIAAAVDYNRKSQGEEFLTPSRLFIYYNERVMEGDPETDSGAQIRDGISSVVTQGVCPESEWPYSDQGGQFAVKPTDQCYAAAAKFKATSYSRVTQVDYFVKHCLAVLRKPVVFGFTVFPSFESDEVAATGVVPMPGPKDSPIGGHAVVTVGYDDAKRLFLVRNSWGASWGQAGYFQFPYAYLLNPNLADDLWTIEAES